MMAKILPLVLLLVGSGAGVAAGLVLRPTPGPDVAAQDSDEQGGGEAPEAGHAEKDGGHGGTDFANAEEAALDDHDEGHGETGGNAFIKMSNQFVVPIVRRQEVAALVVMSLSLEVPQARTDEVFLHEPKLRDSFLQVLFDHANLGGFDGTFTAARNMETLRNALTEVGQRDLSKDHIRDVLITEIARQDY